MSYFFDIQSRSINEAMVNHSLGIRETILELVRPYLTYCDYCQEHNKLTTFIGYNTTVQLCKRCVVTCNNNCMCNCESCIRYWSSDDSIATASGQVIHHVQHGERTMDNWMNARNHHQCDNGICNVDRPAWRETIKTLIGLDASFLAAHRLLCDGCRALRYYANR
jgi:hypothetical protein